MSETVRKTLEDDLKALTKKLDSYETAYMKNEGDKEFIMESIKYYRGLVNEARAEYRKYLETLKGAV